MVGEDRSFLLLRSRLVGWKQRTLRQIEIKVWIKNKMIWTHGLVATLKSLNYKVTSLINHCKLSPNSVLDTPFITCEAGAQKHLLDMAETESEKGDIKVCWVCV